MATSPRAASVSSSQPRRRIKVDVTEKATAAESPYHLRISRLTVDKLGVKLYDKASAVVAELIANSYDADAETVTVRLPLGIQLASQARGQLKDLGYVIDVEDDGHGMAPEEAIDFYLRVGADRRTRKGQDGSRSRNKKRPVMGRKGIGKLAPFGICRRIEVWSAGGPKTKHGYAVTHFFMDFDKIVTDDDEAVPLEVGDDDRTWSKKSGTRVRLTAFLAKRVPDLETFLRQLAVRFTFAKPDFKILILDATNDGAKAVKVNPLDIPLLPGSKIDLSSRPVIVDDGSILPVSGWLGMAKEAYKNEEMMGVRIYARGKIAGVTRDFNQPAGFTGEFAMRSYLVGQVEAEWLDLDQGEDLVRTDRQDILWDSDYGQLLRRWGAELIKEIARISREPRRIRVRDEFLRKSKIEERARERFGDKEVSRVAIDLAKKFGGFAAEDELNDEVWGHVSFSHALRPEALGIAETMAYVRSSHTGTEWNPPYSSAEARSFVAASNSGSPKLSSASARVIGRPVPTSVAWVARGNGVRPSRSNSFKPGKSLRTNVKKARFRDCGTPKSQRSVTIGKAA